MKISHIYWFAYFNMFSPSVRYRAKYPLDHLNKKYGISSTLLFPGYSPYNIFHFIKAYVSCLFFRKKDSLIVIQRVHTNFIYSSALRILLAFQKKNTLYDLDDAEYFDYPHGSIDQFISNCESCSVGSNAVKEYAEKINEQVFLLTSPVMQHNMTKEMRNTILTIGWIGDFAGSHRESMFSIFFPSITDLGFKVKLVILGVREKLFIKEIFDYFATNENIFIEIPTHLNWQDEMSVYSKVKEFDVGICPLIDNEITRAKSAFKIKQYFSCGVPALGSRVGENARFIEDKKNGFICNTPDEYRNAILRIKEMTNEEYESLSKNAKSSVHKFDMEHYCSTILNFYNNRDSN